jgi:hypothetical protein
LLKVLLWLNVVLGVFMLTVRLFQALAAALIAIAILYLVKQDYDIAFVTGVIGICSFFLSVRFTFKPRVEAHVAARNQELDDEPSEPAEPAEKPVL